MRPDPARQFFSSYSYSGNGTNPIIGIDLLGLELRVYSSSAWSAKYDLGTNHVFVYSTELGIGKGRSGSSGNATADDGWKTREEGIKNGTIPYVVVKDLNGMTEEEAFWKIYNYPGWNESYYIPYMDDCHTQLEEAFAYAGLEYPGTPSNSEGRLDWDDRAEWLGWVLGISEIGWFLDVVFDNPQIYSAGHIISKDPLQRENLASRERHNPTASSQSRITGETTTVQYDGNEVK